MHRLLPILVAALASASATVALSSEDEANLTDALARDPGLTFAALLPTAIDEASEDAFRKRPTMVVNADGEPFQVSFDMSMPDYPNVTMTLAISEDASFLKLIERIFSMASAGIVPGGNADTDFPDGFDCVGDVRSLLISCRMGTAGIQFSASDYAGGNSIDYEATKSLFATLPMETYRRLFGPGQEE
jgi:hypothetical protein